MKTFEVLKKGGKTIKEVWVSVDVAYLGARYMIFKDDSGKEYCLGTTKKSLTKRLRLTGRLAL